MKREVTVSELIGFTIIILGAIFGFWMNTNVRLAVLENDSENIKSLFIELKQDSKEIKSIQEETLIKIEHLSKK